MTRKADQIAELQGLTELALRAAQLEMNQLKAKEAALRQNLMVLTGRKTRQLLLAPGVDDPALIAGADLRWQQWVDQRRAAINIELAQVLALMDNCRGLLLQVFGRDQAARSLVDHAKKERRLRASRTVP